MVRAANGDTWRSTASCDFTGPHGLPPAMAAGGSDRLWTLQELVEETLR